MGTTSSKTIFFNAQSYEDTMWGVDSAKTSGTSSYMATAQHVQNGSQWFVFKWTPALMQAQIPADATSVNVQAYITAKTSKGYGEVRIAEARMGYGQPSSFSDANNYTALHTTSGYTAVGGSSWDTKAVTDYKSASVSTLRNSGLYLACRLRNYGGTWGWVQEVRVAECYVYISYTQPIYYALTVNAGTGGTVSGGGTYVSGTAVTIKATPNAGYRFSKWSDGNTNASRTITVSGAATYTAYFVQDTINKIYVGIALTNGVYIGTTKAKEIYIGTTKIYG